ncbi:MAG: GGDEF domain-containing protein [Deltaproteobacteria bacterium]|nr:GGDEF domain-containing protein [Deltaproteobacteria bacterium]
MWLGLAGALLSAGSPLGVALLLEWPALAGDAKLLRWMLVGYVAVGTAIAFALAGYWAGRLLDELVAAREALAQEAAEDPLTGLPNRREFERVLRAQLAQAARTQQPVGLIMVDVDRFKDVNDQHGHPAGDQVLRSIASLVRAACRAGDTPARVGGEEFAVLAPGLATQDVARVAERLRCAVKAAVTHHAERDITVTVSAGVASSDALAAPTSAALVAAADEQLYRAKRAGRNLVCVPGWEAGTLLQGD